jgi:hypothetical protein
MSWDHVRIEPSDTPGYAHLFLMIGKRRAVEMIIACLPVFGVPSKATVAGDLHWLLILDALAEINDRHGRGASVTVETSNGDRWEHTQ